MFIRQIRNAIQFGTDARFHVLSTDRFSHFTEGDVAKAADDLKARYPEESETIERYAERLRAMLPKV